MFHCQDPKTMGKDQDFPVSIEAQLLGGLGKGNPTDEQHVHAGHEHRDERQAVHHALHELEVEDVQRRRVGDGGDRGDGSGTVKHFVNGELVLEYEKPQLDPKDADAKKLIKDRRSCCWKTGTFRCRPRATRVEFRKVEIKVLGK